MGPAVAALMVPIISTPAAAFAWLPGQRTGFSAITIIAIDIAVIWALAGHGRDVTA